MVGKAVSCVYPPGLSEDTLKSDPETGDQEKITFCAMLLENPVQAIYKIGDHCKISTDIYVPDSHKSNGDHKYPVSKYK